MKALASFIVRSQTQAMLAVVGFATLSMFMPLFSYLCGAAVALVTLRKGPVQGLILITLSGLFIGLVALMTSYAVEMLNTIVSLGILIFVLWLLAIVLRQTRSLAHTLYAATAAGITVILMFHFVVDDPTAWWKVELRQFFGPAIEQSGGNSDDMYALIDSWATHMTGFLTAVVIVNTLMCLFIARWWQALLFNPGGFQQEFHTLRLGQGFAFTTLTVAVLAWVPMGHPQIEVQDMLMLMMTVYVIQGLSVIHAVFAMKKLKSVWFIVVYIMVLIMSQLIAMIGFVDTWADLRQRLKVANAG